MVKTKMKKSNSKNLFEKAKILMPGGVNSPVRAFDPYPFFTSHSQGSKLYDVDNNSFIDYCLAYGPLILGHTHPKIIEAVKDQLIKGTLYGTPSELEIKIAELIIKHYPSIDMLRLINSGTEATMHAIRAARGYTAKEKIIKFEGCYHGAHDSVLVKAGSGATTFSAPNSLGIPSATTKNTIVIPFNNLEVLDTVIKQNPDEIAAVILEPVIGNSGLILPKKGYLQEIRNITKEEGILLIFDEIITGFRLSYGGAQEYYNIVPDITTLGKVMGGGFPLAAYGGKKEIMEKISPLGKIYQASTFSGNPISVIAGLTTLKILFNEKDKLYNQLEQNCLKIKSGVLDTLNDLGITAQFNNIASMFQLFFTSIPVNDYNTACKADRRKFRAFHQELMKNHVFIPPSQFETCFISSAHSNDDLNKTLEAFDLALRKIL